MTTPKPTPTLMEFLDRARYRMSMTDDEYDRLRAALEHLEGLRKQAEVFQDCNTGLARERDALRAERDRMVEWLRGRGLQVAESDANFALMGVFDDRRAIWQALLDRGVLIRETGPAGWLRVSVGTPAENEIFRTALEEVLG